MGLNRHSARFLLEAWRDGVPFRRTLLLGRQQLYLNSETLLPRLAASFGAIPPAAVLHDRDFAEPFFSMLGASEIESMDAFADEGATVIHDLNQPLPDSLKERFDVVFDGGTLEHVFNYPRALASAMEAVAVGGRLILATPANNQVNHGFYQLSPELFQAALVPENGFTLERLVLVDMASGRWYEPEERSSATRMPLLTAAPAEILIRARRTAAVRPFATAPQQAYYVSGAGHQTGGRLRRLVASMSRLPGGTLLTNLAHSAYQRWTRRQNRLGRHRDYRRT